MRKLKEDFILNNAIHTSFFLQVEEKKKRDEEQLVTAVFPNILNIITKTSTLGMFSKHCLQLYNLKGHHRKELLSTTMFKYSQRSC